MERTDNDDANQDEIADLNEQTSMHEEARFSPLGTVLELKRNGYSALEAATWIKQCYTASEAFTYLGRIPFVYKCPIPDVSKIKCTLAKASPQHLIEWQETKPVKCKPFKGDYSPYWNFVANSAYQNDNDDGAIRENAPASPDIIGKWDGQNIPQLKHSHVYTIPRNNFSSQRNKNAWTKRAMTWVREQMIKHLTNTQISVIELELEDKTQKQIAHIMKMSQPAISQHRDAAIVKLQTLAKEFT